MGLFNSKHSVSNLPLRRMGLPPVTEPPLGDEAKGKPSLGPNAGLYRAATCISTWDHIFCFLRGWVGCLDFFVVVVGLWERFSPLLKQAISLLLYIFHSRAAVGLGFCSSNKRKVNLLSPSPNSLNISARISFPI